MIKRLTRILLACAAFLVATVLGLAAFVHFKPAPAPTITKPLAELLPHAPRGWTEQDLPIAETPEMQARVESILHFDDAACRVYEAGLTQVTIYVAYWKPGEFSPSKVATHNPATCWVNSGWDMLSRESGVANNLGAEALKPCETGTYEKDRTRLNVIYWHLVGGEPVSYELVGWQNGLAGRIERLPTLVQDFRRYGFDQRREQVLVRISANVPFDTLWKDPGFLEIMKQMGENFGLLGTPAPSAKKPAS